MIGKSRQLVQRSLTTSDFIVLVENKRLNFNNMINYNIILKKRTINVAIFKY